MCPQLVDARLFDGVDGPARGIEVPKTYPSVKPQGEDPSMGEVSTIGLDLAKHLFQVRGIDGTGEVVCAGSCGGARF
jgi:hypothetical protein